MCDSNDKGLALDCAQGSRIVNRGRCRVYLFGMSPNTGGCEAKIYDGIDVNGRLRDDLATNIQQGDEHNYPRGAYFERGIFVQAVVGNPFITVLYDPLPFDEPEL